MKLSINESVFDNGQNALVGEIARAVRSVLERDSSIHQDALNDLTSSLTFAVASTIDRSVVRTTDGDELWVRLAFARSETSNILMTQLQKSYMHEYAHGWCFELYGG